MVSEPKTASKHPLMGSSNRSLKTVQKTEKGENLERTERTEERTKHPLSLCFSSYLRNIKRELLHQSLLLTKYIAKRCKP